MIPVTVNMLRVGDIIAHLDTGITGVVTGVDQREIRADFDGLTASWGKHHLMPAASTLPVPKLLRNAVRAERRILLRGNFRLFRASQKQTEEKNMTITSARRRPFKENRKQRDQPGREKGLS